MILQVRPFDLRRIFFGELPPTMLLEVAFRTAVMFVFTLIVARLMGKRGLGQLSPFDYVIIVALGSSVGDPMFYPDVPLAYAMVLMAVVMMLHRMLARATERNEPVEQFVEGATTRLVKDGVVDIDVLHHERLSRDELFMAMRQQGYVHLGQVKRAYIERSGQVSIMPFPPAEMRPGLPLVPAEDPDGPDAVSAGDRASADGFWACQRCGRGARFPSGAMVTACPNCEERRWLAAVI